MEFDELTNKNNFVFECPYCGNVMFSLKPEGEAECQGCLKKFLYMTAINNWVPQMMNPEEYMIKVLKKKWDKKKQKYIDTNKTPRKMRRNDDNE